MRYLNTLRNILRLFQGVIMSRIYLFLILISLLLPLSTILCPPIVAKHAYEIAYIESDVSLLSNGILAYTFKVNITEKIDRLEFSFPHYISEYLMNYSLEPSSVIKEITVINGEDLFMTIKFKKPLSNATFYLYTVAPTETNATHLLVHIMAFPKISVPIRLVNFTLYYPPLVSRTSIEIINPPSAKVEEIANKTLTRLTFRNIAPYNTSEVIVNLKASLSWPIINTLNKTIILEGDKYSVQEEYLIRNIGSQHASSITIWLPKNTENIEVYGASSSYVKGDYGFGSYTIIPEVNYTILNIKLWYPLRANETIYLRIKYITSKGIANEKGGLFSLSMPPIWWFNLPIKTLALHIKTSDYVYLKDITCNYGNVKEKDDEISVNIRGILGPLRKPIIKVTYSVNMFRKALIRSRSIVTLAIIATIALTLSFFASRQISTRREELHKIKPPMEVYDLLNSIDEYIAIKMEEKDLERSYAQGKLRRSIYQGRKERVTRDLNKLDKRISELSEKVRTSYPMFYKEIEEVLTQLGRLDSEINAIIDVERRYRFKRINREQYIRSVTRYNRLIERRLSRINSLLIALRERLT